MSSTEREPIAVIGTGYVGLVTAAGFAELGNEVWCVDIDEAKIEGLKAGRIPIWEPGLDELVARHRGRLHFSTDLADALEHARLLFVAVGTPPTYSGDADLSAVHAVVDAMPPSDRHALVMKSTVPVGTGDERSSARSPSRARTASATSPARSSSRRARRWRTSCEPDRVVVGDDGDWAGDAVVELYAPLDAPLVRTDIRSRRDGQARLQRVPGHEDLVHQRDRERLRGDRRRRRRGRPRDGPRRPHRPEVPPGRASASAAPASPRT